MLIEVVLLVTAAVFIKAVSTKQEKILGIYSQPGPFYWLKWILFFTLYRWRTSKATRRDRKYDDGSDLRFVEDSSKEEFRSSSEVDYGSGKRSKQTPAMMERTQPIADTKFAIDAVYFNGFEHNSSSISDDITVVMAFTTRYRKFAEILFFLNVPGVGFLQHPAHPDRIICDARSDEYAYQGQGMKIEMLEPMRRWVLKYNGLMRIMDVKDRKVAKKSDRLVHVKFSLMWRSYSDYIDFDTDISASCMAHAFACEEWSRDFFQRVERHHSHQTHYEQWGQLQGVIHVEGREPREAILRGLRDHSFSRRDWRHFYRYLICIIHLDDGTSINATDICMDVTITRLTMGYIIHPNHLREDITEVDIKLWEFGEDGSIPEQVHYTFVAGGKKYVVICKIRIVPEFYNGFEYEGRVVETLADYHVNGVAGRGIAEFCYRHNEDRRKLQDCCKSLVKSYKEPFLQEAELKKSLAVSLEDDRCLKESLVGGKGSQLAILKRWSCETEKFVVPDGFCITTSAYKKHTEENDEISKLLATLSDASNLSEDQTKDLCNRISVSFENSKLSDELKDIIEEKYSAMNNNNQRPMVAVRSSAVGEDSPELSAAGQLETFLGIAGPEKVAQFVKKCWGCQYSYNAVQYRRHHGQPLVSSMGVVVQILVDAEVSGVMFTQHPVTGHPAHTLLSCNYGLGETVVSGTSEPDTIVVACRPNNNSEILSKQVGSKAKKMLVEDSGKIEQKDVELQYSSVSCMDNDQIFQLVDVGQMIQSYSGAPRDIEWAISSTGTISLLQSRPITSDPTESDYELMHEFDSAYSNDNYVLTTANIGEMMTGPITPLTSSTFLRSIDFATQAIIDTPTPRGIRKYNDIVVTQSHGHLFLNYLEMLRTNDRAMLGSRKDSIDVNLFGEICDKVTKQEAIEYHDNATSILKRIRNAIRFWKYMLGATKEFDEVLERAKKVHFNVKSSQELYRAISKNLGPIYAESWRTYIGYAALSGVSTTVLMMILSRGQSEWKREHYSDVAMIYSSCENVVSVCAPSLMRETARHIHESTEKDLFVSSSAEDAIQLLMSSKSKAGDTFRLFLDKCGHRCVRESEFSESSWAKEPTKLAASLQAMVKNYKPEETKTVMSVDEAISRIKTPLTMTGRLILKRAIPRARKSVAGREYGKSNAIKVSDAFKQAYWKLASMLEKEGYLPDKDLMFFLTHGEIGRILRTRSAFLVAKAMRRRRIYNDQLHLVFDEFQIKIPPSPSNTTAQQTYANGAFSVNGFPVSHGVVKGKARVATSLKQADDINRGDILIVRTTDVGWSPYFPLIAGLVTEIGGLISHGATVAREYGLPCVVGAKRATQLFKTGDYVQLDGGKGTICKLAE